MIIFIISLNFFFFANTCVRQPSVNMFPIDEKTDLFTNSDLNLLAAKKFDHVLRQIQESSLNFQIVSILCYDIAEEVICNRYDRGSTSST